MKITKELLKQMIAEERANFTEKADPTKLPKDKFPMKLSQVDMDTARALAQAGDDDGKDEDDTIGVRKDTMPVSQLKPAQSTMKIANAMGMALAMMRGDMKPGGDLGGFISQDGHILDGHHRWVATAMVNPEAEVGGFVVDFPASEIIAVLNTITKGLLGIEQGKKGSGSFAQFQVEPMRKQLQDFMENGIPGKFPVAPEKIVAQVKQATGMDDPAQARDALVQRFAKNLQNVKFQVPAGAPERVDMPVIDPELKDGALEIAVNALTKGLVDVNPPYAVADLKAVEDDEQGEQEMQESKKDLLKRIVAEEVAKMEIDAMQEEGALDEIFGLFGDGKLKMIEKEIIPKFRKGLAKRRRHHQDVPSHYWHYVIAEAIRRAYNEYENTEYREATRKSEEWKKLGEEIDALVSDAYNLVKTNAMKSKTADAQDRKKMLSLDAYEADSKWKGTAKSYIP